jgi:hypothetical protein
VSILRSLSSALVAVVLALPARAQTPAALPLIPLPREATVGTPFAAPRGLTIETPTLAEDRAAAGDLTDVLRERGQLARGGARGVAVRLLRRDTPAGRAVLSRAGLAFDSAMAAEGYVLVSSGAGGGSIDVVGASAAGVFYGAQTVKQLVEGTGPRARVLGLRVRDWPAMRWRGFHDDLSRGPVPTLEFQKKQIRTFAAFKMNVYSPYFEHTITYASNPLFAPPTGAMTRADVAELVAYAQRYHVEIVPEQESFGHLHHVLRWEKYTPIGEFERGSVLAPSDPRTIPLVRQLFVELDSLFPGKFLHIGADETFDLGRGRTAERVKTEGYNQVYLGFLKQIADTLRPLGRRLLFWGDIAGAEPALVPMLPKDMIAVPWYYDTALPSYDKLLQPFRQAGLETWVAPGVNNWGLLYPAFDVSLGNIRAFVREGQKAGATGMLNTSWDDWGETLFAQTWLAVLYGAAASWQAGDSDPERFLAAYPRVFHGDTAGHVLTAERRLMDAHAILRKAGVGQAADRLFWIDPWSSEGRLIAAKLLPVARDLRLAAEDAIEAVIAARTTGAVREPEALAAIELGARRIDMVGLKFQTSNDIAAIYGRVYPLTRDSATAKTVKWFDLADITGINGRLQDLRDMYAQSRELYEAAWLRENRPYWLHNVLARFDLATQLWVSRIDQMNDVRAVWSRTQRIPPADSLGMPAPVAVPSAAREPTPGRR